MRRLLLAGAVLAGLGTVSAVVYDGLIAPAHADDTNNGGQGG
jgi:hypothetical protein